MTSMDMLPDSGIAYMIDALVAERLATHALVDDAPHGLSRVRRLTCSVCGCAVLQMPGGPQYGSATERTCSAEMAIQAFGPLGAL